MILDDLVGDITARLMPGSELCLDGGWRPVRPADIAVLVRKNERGEAIRERLVAAGVPAVMHGATSVYTSPMAQEWLTLLVALEQPRQAAVRQAALTCFLGLTFAELARAEDDELIQLTQRVRRWSRVLDQRGVAALLETMSVDTRVPERLLATVGGERRLTDVRHLAQSLHGAMTAGQLGISALVEWLRGRMAEALTGLTEGTRRLETDALAVTILTVHRSKGLEFPIVYLPEAWDRFVNNSDDGGVLRFHRSTPDGRSECLLDVGGLGPGRADRWQRQRAEESGEDLRLLYVAATRAQCQAVTWWAPSVNTPASALHRFLYRDRTAAVVEAHVSAGRRPVRPPGPTGDRAGGPGAAAGGPLAAGRRTVRSAGGPHLRPPAGPELAPDVLLGTDGGRAWTGPLPPVGGQRAGSHPGGRRDGTGRTPTTRPTGRRSGGPGGTSSRRWPICPRGWTSGPRCTRCSRWSTRPTPSSRRR